MYHVVRSCYGSAMRHRIQCLPGRLRQSLMPWAPWFVEWGSPWCLGGMRHARREAGVRGRSPESLGRGGEKRGRGYCERGREGSWSWVGPPEAGCQEEKAGGGGWQSPPGGVDWPGSGLHPVYKLRGEGDLLPILQVRLVLVEGSPPWTSPASTSACGSCRSAGVDPLLLQVRLVVVEGGPLLQVPVLVVERAGVRLLGSTQPVNTVVT